MCIIFDKVDGVIRDYNGIQYLALFGSEKYNSIFSKIRFLMKVKGGISYLVSRNYPKIKINSDNGSPLEKTSIIQQEKHAAMLIKSVFNKTHYFYLVFCIPRNMFLWTTHSKTHWVQKSMKFVEVHTILWLFNNK